jgi:2-(1,2-epoxy-1,2-dihydrophenyl)acetyl-CoA isomerase
MFSTLQLQVRERVAHLMLDRPDAMNTLSLDMGRELLRAALQCEGDAAVRAVILTGAGKAFCAGGDLRGMQAQGAGTRAYLQELTVQLHAAISVFTRMDAPVVAAINGITAGAGVGLATMADLSIAAQSAKFTLAYTGVGLTPDGSTTFFLPRLIGLKRTAELMLLNRTLTADEALDWGLINTVVPDADLAAHALELAQRLAQGPPSAYGAVKRLLALSSGALETQMMAEGRCIAAQAVTPEGQEGINAFLAKRKPKF